MMETRQSKIAQDNIAKAIASGISANGIIVSGGSSSQVIAIKIIDNKPYAMLTDKTTVDVSTYTITDTVQEQATYWA